jgi:hypothetical protein
MWDSKKKHGDGGGSDSPLDIQDLTEEVPDVDNALDEIDRALGLAERTNRSSRSRQPEVRRSGSGCGCWG